MPNWDTDNDGFIIFKAVTGWETALLALTGCGLRVQFAHRPNDIGGQSGAIQFAMSPKQALQLAADLTEMANNAAHVPPGTNPS